MRACAWSLWVVVLVCTASAAPAPSASLARGGGGGFVQTGLSVGMRPEDMEANFMEGGGDNNNVLSSAPVMDQPVEQPQANNPPPPLPVPSLSLPSEPAAEPAAQKREQRDVVIAIPSMRRWTKQHQPAPDRYLAPLLNAIWDDASEEERRHVQFLLLNVDPDPEKHTELTDFKSHPAVQVLTKLPSARPNIPPPDSASFMLGDQREVSEQTFEWVAGETSDAPQLWLEASKRAPFVLFLEDDVKPTSHVLRKVFGLLDELDAEGKADFFMVDLYTPAISWGPQHAANKEPYAFECCTQAMLFNSKFVPDLVSYELAHPTIPVDDNIRDWARQRPGERKVLAMVPNAFEHVGRFSSNPEKSSDSVEHTSLSFVP